MSGRTYQPPAIEWLAAQERGLLHAPAGSGKTRMALEALARRKPRRALWVAHTQEQVQQAYTAAREVCPDANLGLCCYAGMRPAEIEAAELIICDECHHLSGSSWGGMLSSIARHRSLWGLSATPFCGDSDRDQFLLALFGNNQFSISVEQVRACGGLAPGRVHWIDELEPDPVLQEKVDQAVQARAEYLLRVNKRLGTVEAKQRATWEVNHRMGIVEHAERNRRIAATAMGQSVLGSTLVLANHVEHLEVLAELAWAPSVHGKLPKKKRTDLLAAFAAGDIPLLFGTASLFGEGYDCPRLRCIVNAAGGKSPIAVVQRAGRSARVFEGKEEGVVVDFTDRHLRCLANHANARRAIYDSLGYQQQ